MKLKILIGALLMLTSNVKAIEVSNYRNSIEPIEQDSSISGICKCSIDQIILKAKLMCISPGVNNCYFDTIYSNPIQDELNQMKTFWYLDVVRKCLYIRVIDTVLQDDNLLLMYYEGPKGMRLTNFYLIKVYGFSENDKKHQKYLLKHPHYLSMYEKLYPVINRTTNMKRFFRRKFKQESNYSKYIKRVFFTTLRVN